MLFKGWSRNRIENGLDISVSCDSMDHWFNLFLTTGEFNTNPVFHLGSGRDIKLPDAQRDCALQLLKYKPTLFLDEIILPPRRMRLDSRFQNSALAVELGA
ncbi:hypothetical protein CROQUDRAFT_705352 [Cronartium quercuum f. sp. fusiforme G11]|uniref:Uncharacterized protein n=1 Tax=Cronartium quercuum f. sp. fusiforme G11 TaxID=708437 RepID=A0A9P6TAW8_9BASI|nr:hypothetical protein CROQUDRAFT_705352 [Cronartium quercuum f. sp. fusiforme G11]